MFPAFMEETAPVVAEKVADDTEASCFYHPAKRAVLACDGCGRFICALCEVEMEGRHLCPQCLESGQRKGKLASLEAKRTLYADIALALTIFPLIFFFYLTFITAPAALFVLFWYRKAPDSLVRRRSVQWWLALVFAIAEIGVWAFVAANLYGVGRSHPPRSPVQPRSLMQPVQHRGQF